jgi:four helix bundle protein
MGSQDSKGQQASFIRSHRDLEVYGLAFEAAMKVFEYSRAFPIEERYSLTDQIHRSSRAICANLAEAWRRRRYEKSFLLRLNDAEAEAAETQTWIEFAVKCGYLDVTVARTLYTSYDHIIGKLVTLINHPEKWLLK